MKESKSSSAMVSKDGHTTTNVLKSSYENAFSRINFS